jgi:hypothetical protein
LEELNADVLLVSFETLHRTRLFIGDDMGWPILSDPERNLYRAYGLERLNFIRTWLSPRTLAYYLRAAAAGRRIRRPQSDSRQLGGDFIIDGRGVVVFAHRTAEPADRPPLGQLLAAVRGTRERRGDPDRQGAG